MNKLVILPLLLSLLVALPAAAVRLTAVSPGGLSRLVDDPEDLAELSLQGSIDASDLFFMARNMPSLTSLDLNDVEIVAYKGEAVGGQSSYPAGLIPTASFAGTRLRSLVLPSHGSLTIGDAAFAGTDISSLTIPSNVISAGMGAFSSCPSLASVSLPGSLGAGTYLFAGCTSLAAVNLGGRTDIPDAMFSGCTALHKIEGATSVSEIGARAFLGCRSLEAFPFSPELKTIGDEAFARTGLAAAGLSACRGLRSVGAWTFAECPSLVSVSLPATLTEVGRGAFFDCASLAAISLPSSLRSLSDYVLKGGSALAQTPALGESVESVGMYALKDVAAVEAVVLPSSLQYIGDGAMEGMIGLKAIYGGALAGVPATGTDVWRGVDKASVSLFVGPEVADGFRAADQWCEFNIIANPTGIENTETTAGGASQVSARFDGTVLCIVSRGADISRLRLFDPAGRLIADLPGASSSLSLDTSGFVSALFIAECTLADGTCGILKLKRP